MVEVKILCDLLKIKGPFAVQIYLVNGVQEVYRLQGITINNEHIEVIVRQGFAASRSAIRAIRPSWRAKRLTATISSSRMIGSTTRRSSLTRARVRT